MDTNLPATPWNAMDFRERFDAVTERSDLLDFVKPEGIGIELGVAAGTFANILMQKKRLGFLYGVDLYGDERHSVAEYRKAITKMMRHRKRYNLLRMRFDEALPLFPDNYFDFVFIDGFAANGEEDGKTLVDWLPKVAPGGILAGHDYDPKWPKVIKSVNRFFAERPHLELFVTKAPPEDAPVRDKFNQFRSWFTVRPMEPDGASMG